MARAAVRLLVEFVAFALLLFVARFVARPHLAVQLDEECYIGGIAVDVLAHGVRFPFLVYAQNDHDNGALFSGVLAAVSFSVLGRRLLALKLVMHLVWSAGAVAALRLLRGCLRELRIANSGIATATLVIALALAPRLVTGAAMCTVGFGTPEEGSAISAVLLALVAWRARERSAASTAGIWATVGFALFLNKGTAVILPVLVAAEIALGWTSRRRLAAALGGFGIGVLPELLVNVQLPGVGWTSIANLAIQHIRGFPRTFFDSLLNLADERIDLVAAWGLALGACGALFLRSVIDSRRGGSVGARGPFAILGIVVGAACAFFAALAVIAQGGLDYYAVYGYPILAVLLAVFVGALCARATARFGRRAGAWIGAGAIAATLVVHRPDAVSWGVPTVAALWGNSAGAACSWRFAEGFEREYGSGLASAGETNDEHVIERCRSLSEPAQALDCIGGMGRDLHVHRGEKVAGEPPSGLTPTEQRAFAFYYGIRRNGNLKACRDFRNPDLRYECSSGVRMDCLFNADFAARVFAGHVLPRPMCVIVEPPLTGYWSALRGNFLARAPRSGTEDVASKVHEAFPACEKMLVGCY